jgi:hypothetical protein
MKRFLLWSFERGSIHYDIICGIILAFILFAPGKVFNDRPAYMGELSVLDSGPDVRPSHDDEGNTVFIVKSRTGVLFSTDEPGKRQTALKLLAEKLKIPLDGSKMEAVYDTRGTLVAYAIWVER